MIQVVAVRFVEYRTIVFGRPWVWLRTLINPITGDPAPSSLLSIHLHITMGMCVYMV